MMVTLRNAAYGLVISLGVVLALAINVPVALAQTAQILPNAKTQFLNANGQPVAGGSLYTCVPNTSCGPSPSSPATTWQDAFQMTANADPVVLDSAGSAFIFGNGNYTEALYDAQGNLIWSGYTTAPGTISSYGGNTTLGSWWSDVSPFTANPDFRVRDRLFVDDGSLATSTLGSGSSCIPNTRGGTALNTYGDGAPKVSCYSSLYVLSSNGYDAIGAQTTTALQNPANTNLGVAVLGQGFSNNTSATATAWGAFFEGQRLAPLGWAFGAEIQVGNDQSVQPSTIYGNNDKQSIGVKINCASQTGATDCSSGLVFAQILGLSGTPHFDRGIVFLLNSVSDQGGGVFNAINFPNQYRINWWRNNSSTDELQAYIVASDSTPGDQVQSLVLGSATATTTLNSSNFILAGNSTNTTLTISSGATGNIPALSFSRTATDGSLADIAATNQVVTGTAVGDIVLVGHTNVWLVSNQGSSTVAGVKVKTTGLLTLPQYGAGALNSDSSGNITTSSYAGALTVTATGIDFNSVADTAIPFVLPP